jgi:hypothetical protein
MAVLGVTLAVSTKATGLDEMKDLGRDRHVILDFIQWSQPVRSMGYLTRLTEWEKRKGKEVRSYGRIWVTRRDQAALVLAGSVLAIPSVNLTPSMTRGN